MGRNLTLLAATMALLGLDMSDRTRKSRIFGCPRGGSIGPGTGPGSGRRARCKQCGEEGIVVGTHADGSRKIEGCSCSALR